jgi:hypothetical protein
MNRVQIDDRTIDFSGSDDNYWKIVVTVSSDSGSAPLAVLVPLRVGNRSHKSECCTYRVGTVKQSIPPQPPPILGTATDYVITFDNLNKKLRHFSVGSMLRIIIRDSIEKTNKTDLDVVDVYDFQLRSKN